MDCERKSYQVSLHGYTDLKRAELKAQAVIVELRVRPPLTIPGSPPRPGLRLCGQWCGLQAQSKSGAVPRRRQRSHFRPGARWGGKGSGRTRPALGACLTEFAAERGERFSYALYAERRQALGISHAEHLAVPLP